jgi:hypothetical protein
MADERDDKDEAEFANGPNAVCYTCGGFRKVSEPRLYAVQATREIETGMTLAEWRTCPQCHGKGQLPGITPPA